VTRVFSEKISTRATRRPELEAAVKLAGEIRPSGVAVTLVVHEHKRLGRGIELAMLAEELKASDVGLEFLTGELKGSHDPSGIVFTVLAAMSGMEREYIRDRTLEGHESARKRGKTIGGAGVRASMLGCPICERRCSCRACCTPSGCAVPRRLTAFWRPARHRRPDVRCRACRSVALSPMIRYRPRGPDDPGAETTWIQQRTSGGTAFCTGWPTAHAAHSTSGRVPPRRAREADVGESNGRPARR
jgi:hypothetical protein